MNKAELIEQIAESAEITKVQANAAMDAFTDAIVSALQGGDRVTLVGFGTFSVSERSARNGRNPQTGATIKIKARKVPKFKAGKEFSENISNGKGKKGASKSAAASKSPAASKGAATKGAATKGAGAPKGAVASKGAAGKGAAAKKSATRK